MRVAVLGTGIMGAPVARNLAAAGHAVRAWNRTRAKAEGLGAEVAATPAEAVAGAEAVVTMLADGPAVEAVMAEALPALDAGAVWIQMSTVGVAYADRLAALAAERGVPLLDAPVMGSKAQAEAGELVPLVAGPPAARERCSPVFDAIAREVVVVADEPGAASRLKLVANLWVLSTVQNLAEVLLLTEALDLEPEQFFGVIRGAAFDMPYAHWKGELMLKREFSPAFPLRLARKDVGLALEAAAAAGLELPVAGAALAQFTRALELGHGDEDSSAVWYATARPRGGGAGDSRS